MSRLTESLIRMWDREYATFHVWQACKRRQLYKENWIEWADLEKARGVEAFRFLDENLRSSTLSVAVPGGAEWWPDERPPTHREPRLLQKREPSAMQLLPSTREGFNLLGTPERDARPAWLTAVQSGDRAAGGPDGTLPFWMEAAIRLGTRFHRIAAAGVPPAASLFEPRTQGEDCVTCCEECGCSHSNLVDEYYFWLVPAEVYEPAPAATLAGAPNGFAPGGDYQNGYQDDYYDTAKQQSAVWQDPSQLPQLLAWGPQPAVRLAWCRIHNREFQQPRQSLHALRVDSTADADLGFLGRTADSLTFSVSPSGKADPSAPGFRYDLPEDSAVVLPEVAPAPPPPVFVGPAKLPAYPWFLFDAPGASVIPLSAFSPSLAVARALRSHCRFEAALAWYRQALDPLQQDCTWIDCEQDNARRFRRPEQLPEGDACCDSTDITCDQARDRAVVLEYLETLVEWSEAVMRRDNSPEEFAQARTILDTAATILGEAPCTVKLPESSDPGTVSEFSPAFPPLNPRLLDLYEIVRDRLENIRACMNAYRLRNDPRGYFGSDPVREGWRTTADPCAEEGEWCYLRSPYRFMFLIQKAQEYATRVQELGNALQAAFEKGDAEFLASLRSGQEQELLILGLEAKQDMWRDADWQIEALQKTKAVSQATLSYFTGLKGHGLIGGEVTYEDLTEASTFLRGAGNGLEAAGGAMSAAGNYFLGVAGFGGTPLSYYQLPIGEPLAFDFAAAARILMGLADIANSNAGLQLTEAGFQRRVDEWNHQIDILTIEIQQIERQILGAQRRRDQLLHDLNTHQRQIEQSREVQDFLRDKFTAHDLYLYLQKETFALYSNTYDLALYAARQAQHAFNLERGHTTRHFLPDYAWDDLHEGLLAGERLSAALRQMEKAYLDENVREYELTKHFSLRLHFPAEFLKLLTTGYCEIDIPEWMFDLDFPGHYMRRIKSIAMTIPCVTGPFSGVHCRLTLLSSFTRIDPRLSAPKHECCCPPEPFCTEWGEEERLGREYLACPDDPRAIRQYGAREAVATSNGQNDSGLFQLDFNDPRYLPFEYMGAVSRWRIELPPENNYFDLNTLTDLVLRLGYTAREGGAVLRRAARAAARKRLPGDGWRFLDVRHEFPDAWQRFLDGSGEDRREARLELCLARKIFPFVPGGQEIWIGSMAILFGKHEHEDCDCPRSEGCPCPEHGRRACHIVEFIQVDEDCEKKREVQCRTSETCSDLYCGILDTRIGPLGGKRHHAEIEFRFDTESRDIEHVYLLCRYRIASLAGGVPRDVARGSGVDRGSPRRNMDQDNNW
jgi:Tc toxin complex TcA C-terminal TcB-binding domain